MNADERRLKINAITEAVIGAAHSVTNSLGAGFLEKVYENALAHELRKRGREVQQQFPITVYYDGVVVGEYVADMIVDTQVLVEIKAVKRFDEIHVAQCLNYLRATRLPVCLLLNFGSPRVDIKRLVHNF